MQVEVRLVGFSLTATFSSIDGTRHPEFEGLAGLSCTSLKPHQYLHLCVTRSSLLSITKSRTIQNITTDLNLRICTLLYFV